MDSYLPRYSWINEDSGLSEDFVQGEEQRTVCGVCGHFAVGEGFVGRPVHSTLQVNCEARPGGSVYDG